MRLYPLIPPTSHVTHERGLKPTELIFVITVLRPVNEYKIADKIIEANRELFGDDYDPTAEVVARPTANEEAGGRPAICQFASIDLGPADDGRRRVSFSRLLEDFEPDFITDNEDDDDEPTQDYSVSESEPESEEVPVRGSEPSTAATLAPDKINMMLDSPNRRRQNQPPPCPVGNNNNNDGAEKIVAVDSKPTIAIAPNSPVSGDPDSDPEIDEICEVIEEFGLANPHKLLSPTVSPVALTTGVQADAECDKALNTDDNIDDQLSQSSDSTQSGDSQKEHEMRQSSGTAAGGTSKSSRSDNRVVRARTTSVESDTKLRPKSSSHTYHQPVRSNSQHSSSTPLNTHSSHHHHSHPHRGVDHNRIMKIQLNFKPCCELKNADAARRLPSYCGYVSQYGLSKEQLEQRAARRERHHMRRERRVENRAVEESNKSRVNEEAFARWLAVKMRTTRTTNGSGSRNMYDYVPSKKIANNKVATEANKRAKVVRAVEPIL